MRKIIFLRGIPGSGKSTRSRELREEYECKGRSVCILSTDDYWGEDYNFQIEKLKEAHEWNQERAKCAMEAGTEVVIIDNTNVRRWEMQPYAKIAQALKYEMEIVEPSTSWAFNAEECALRTVHKVPLGKIQQMLSRWETVNVETLTN